MQERPLPHLWLRPAHAFARRTDGRAVTSVLRGVVAVALLASTSLPACKCERTAAPAPSPDAANAGAAPSASASSASDAAWGAPGAEYLRDAPFSMLMHVDTPMALMAGKRIDQESDVHLSLPRIQKGQVGAFAAALFVPIKYQKRGTGDYCTGSLRKLDGVLREHERLLRPAWRADDFGRNWRDGRTSVLRSIEGSWCLQGRVDSIDKYHAQGVRMIALTWQGDHEFAMSWPDQGHVGLTALGRKAVERMNQLGLMVDVSHMSDRAIEDVLTIARAPVIASHSNARALCNHRRNLTDEHIRRIAASGGVIGINFYRAHLREEGGARVEDVLAHIRHVQSLSGIEAVALGSDYDGIDGGPEGLRTSAELPNLRRAMRAAGFTAPEVNAVFGGNFLRVLREVERRATR